MSEKRTFLEKTGDIGWIMAAPGGIMCYWLLGGKGWLLYGLVGGVIAGLRAIARNFLSVEPPEELHD